MAGKKSKKKTDTSKKNDIVKKGADTVKNISRTYYKVKKAMYLAAAVATVFGLSFAGSFFRDPQSALSTFSYEVHDIVYEIFSDFDNLEYGIPGRQDTIINREGYAIGYSNAMKQPLWVCYNLTAEEVSSEKAKRGNDFRSDWRLWGKSAQLEDYKGSKYDRGHMAPAADMTWSSKAMSQSFFMSNMSPQDASLNRGAWKKLESHARKMAKKYKKIHVISGPVFINANKKYIGKSRVGVPEAYFKILYAPEQNEMIGFILPNKDTSPQLKKYAVSVYDVEDASQLEFFMKLSPDVRKKLKISVNKEFWNL